MWMASTVIVPMSNVAFSLKFMPRHQPMKIWDGLGLVVIMLGLVIYRFTAGIHSLWAHYTHSFTSADLASEKLEHVIEHKVQKQQVRFIGLNQMEALNAVVEARVSHERTRVVHRSPTQIRNNLLVKLGLPASPMISSGARNRGVSSNSPTLRNGNGNGNGAGNGNGNGAGAGAAAWPIMGERRLSESWDQIKRKTSDPVILPRPNLAASLGRGPSGVGSFGGRGGGGGSGGGGGIAMVVSPLRTETSDSGEV